MMISRGLVSYTGYTHTIGNADLVDLLELGSEQTIEGVLKTNILELPRFFGLFIIHLRRVCHA